MENEGPNWGGLLKGSLSHTDDGNNPSPNLSEEDKRRFVDQAMQSQTFDVVKRMKEITLVMQTPEQILTSQGITPQDIEDMLSELQEPVESIDIAIHLHFNGGLVPLLGYLKSSHANLKAKAAEVISTIVQNKPRSKQFVMDTNGLQLLLSNFKSDSDLIVRTKALEAISSLIMHNKHGISAFRLANGYASLRDALRSESVSFQRKALNLMNYILHVNRSDFRVFSNLGFHGILTKLELSSKDVDIRQAARVHLAELNPNKITTEEWLNSITKKRPRNYETKLDKELRTMFNWTIG